MKSFLLILFSVCCLSFAPKKKDVYEIKFGSGGGITGLYSYYLLNQKSELYTQQGNTSIYLKKVNSSKTAKLFKTIQSDQLLNCRYNKPGSYTNQIFIIKNQIIINQIQWNSNDSTAPKYITDLYKSLNNLLK
jgi:hypothetical protein